MIQSLGHMPLQGMNGANKVLNLFIHPPPQAMHLVYRAMEKEPVPSTLPSSQEEEVYLFPPLSCAVAVLPALSPPLNDTLRSTPSHGSITSINSTGSLSPKHSFKGNDATPTMRNWVVPVADRGCYDDIFLKTDTDMDGLVTGGEVIEIFMQSSLPQIMLAQIWGLADTKQTGKLSREQFSLAMWLIQQKVTNGLDPPQTLTPEMIPPSKRTTTTTQDSSSSTESADLTGTKELHDISQEIAQLQREKYTLEQDIRDKEEGIRQKNNEVQIHSDQQRNKLDGMLNDVRQQCQDESTLISSLQTQIHSQESDIHTQEDELSRTKSDLNRLQQDETQLEQSLLAGRMQLDSIIKSLKVTQDEINQVRGKRERREGAHQLLFVACGILSHSSSMAERS
uniref:Epidermal growth factor receptor pathway substrate 15 like 1 n=1 Tax=Salmo trutta TaxID=8032 RepID=A0A673W5M2_SALTR